MQSWSGRPNGAGGRWSLIWDERLEGLFGLAQGEFDRTFEMYVSLLHADDREDGCAPSTAP